MFSRLPIFNTSLHSRRLNERLEDIPNLEFMLNGHYVEQPGRLQVTNMDMVTGLARSLTSVLQTSQSKIHESRSTGNDDESPTRHITASSSSSIDEMPKLLVIGTCVDQAYTCDESIEAKNRKLIEALKPFAKKCIRMPNNDLIHPVNTLVTVDEGRKADSERLCEVILNSHGTKQDIELPIRWFAFKLEVLKFADEQEHEILSLEMCCKMGASLEMTTAEVLEALKYLDSLGLILYFHEILNTVVFIRPQALLKRLSDLISLSFLENLERFPKFAYTLPPDSHRELKEEGCFTIGLIEVLHKEFQDGLFSANDFLKLMKYLLIIAEVPHRDGIKYFIPSVLPWDRLRDNELISFERPELDPIFLIWEDRQPVPYGVFPATVNALLSRKEKPMFDLTKTENKQFQHRRNAVFLTCKEGSLLLLIDEVCLLKLYYAGNPVDCPSILKAVKGGVQDAAIRFHYHKSFGDVQEAFNVRCDLLQEQHLGVVCHGATPDSQILEQVCCEEHGKINDLSIQQSRWFKCK